jgi:hypothetical protein
MVVGFTTTYTIGGFPNPEILRGLWCLTSLSTIFDLSSIFAVSFVLLVEETGVHGRNALCILN